jgi:Uma2 family endonuclease
MNSSATIDTLADLVERLGQVPLDRIRMRPAPGTATVEDVIRIEQDENRLCELVEGVLVEKVMGFRESLLAIAIAHYLREYAVLQLFPGLVRMPDVAFVSWQSMPEGRVPADPAPHLAPDLAVEVLSRKNTVREMERKREEYFAAGVKLVWMVDPNRRTITVFTSPEEFREYALSDTLDGGLILPGFSLSLEKLFAELDQQAV